MGLCSSPIAFVLVEASFCIIRDYLLSSADLEMCMACLLPMIPGSSSHWIRQKEGHGWRGELKEASLVLRLEPS